MFLPNKDSTLFCKMFHYNMIQRNIIHDDLTFKSETICLEHKTSLISVSKPKDIYKICKKDIQAFINQYKKEKIKNLPITTQDYLLSIDYYHYGRYNDITVFKSQVNSQGITISQERKFYFFQTNTDINKIKLRIRLYATVPWIIPFYPNHLQFILTKSPKFFNVDHIDENKTISSYKSKKVQSGTYNAAEIYENIFNSIVCLRVENIVIKKYTKTTIKVEVETEDSILNFYNAEYVTHILITESKDFENINIQVNAPFRVKFYVETLNYTAPPPKTKKKLLKEDKCCICLDSTPNILYPNCGHICTCNKCEEIQELTSCPKCRTNVTTEKILC